jgi:hypothetical protein
VGLHLSQIAEADELLTNDPLALLIGMVLDQQVSERTSAGGAADRQGAGPHKLIPGSSIRSAGFKEWREAHTGGLVRRYAALGSL